MIFSSHAHNLLSYSNFRSGERESSPNHAQFVHTLVEHSLKPFFLCVGMGEKTLSDQLCQVFILPARVLISDNGEMVTSIILVSHRMMVKSTKGLYYEEQPARAIEV